MLFRSLGAIATLVDSCHTPGSTELGTHDGSCMAIRMKENVEDDHRGMLRHVSDAPHTQSSCQPS